jgi:mono/diheme cytochrome c family protein
MTRLSILLISVLLIYVACKHELPAQPVDPGSPQIPGTPGTPGIPGTPGSNLCSADTVYFQQQILPIFVSNCTFSGCHDNITQQDGINLTTYNGIRAEVEAGDLNDSKIWEKINESDPGDRMPPPPRNPLSAVQKELIRKWILQGAKNNSCQPSTCDTVNVTYSINIRSIVAAKCQGCHSSANPANGYDLSTYSGLKARVVDGKLHGAINHLPGFSPMPKNGAKLSDCELATFRKWIDAGALNN